MQKELEILKKVVKVASVNPDVFAKEYTRKWIRKPGKIAPKIEPKVKVNEDEEKEAGLRDGLKNVASKATSLGKNIATDVKTKWNEPDRNKLLAAGGAAIGGAAAVGGTAGYLLGKRKAKKEGEKEAGCDAAAGGPRSSGPKGKGRGMTNTKMASAVKELAKLLK